MLIKAIICFFVLIIVPEILGLLITKFTENKSILFSFLIGYLIEFSVLECLAVPMILKKLKFTTLLYSWSTVIVILLILAIILNIKQLKLRNLFNKPKEKKFKPNIICIIAIILVGIQMAISIVYTHIDDDDAFYVGTATTTITRNKMYRISAENGGYYGKLPSRYILAPFPLYTAIISSITHVHPAIMAHTIFAPLFIGLAYMVYYLLGMRLFKNNITDVSVFLILLSIINIFGNYSIRTNFTFLLFRIWQGKAILANIMLPSIWLMVWNYAQNRKFINWLCVFIAMISTCLVSEMGIALGSITLALLAVIFAIKNRKITDLLCLLICILPCMINLGIYLKIK